MKRDKRELDYLYRTLNQQQTGLAAPKKGWGDYLEEKNSPQQISHAVKALKEEGATW